MACCARRAYRAKADVNQEGEIDADALPEFFAEEGVGYRRHL